MRPTEHLLVISESADLFTGHAKYIWNFEEPSDALGQDWAHLFNHASTQDGIHTVDWLKIVETESAFLGGLWSRKGPKTSACILLYARWFLLQSLQKAGIEALYDRYIITRSDYLFPIPHPPLEMLDSKYIWVPEGEDYGGITDRHIVIPRQYIRESLSVLDPTLRYPHELHKCMSRVDPNWNLERYLMMYLFNAGLLHKVRRVPACMYTIRANDTKTSWCKGEWNSKLGFNIKYPDEFERTNQTVYNYNGSWKQIARQHVVTMQPEKFITGLHNF